MDSQNETKGFNDMDVDKESNVDKMGSEEKKKEAVQAEMKRVNQLPANSSYGLHRMRVLNKILELISIKRTTSQDEELELLFAGLSI